MIRLTNTLVIANIFSGPLPPATQAWLAAHLPADRLLCLADPVPLTEARNLAVATALAHLRAGDEWIWFLDNDLTIADEGLAAWLAIEGDIVSCRARMRSPLAWCLAWSFHCSFFRARPRVFRELPGPWFKDVPANCECLSFAARAHAAGYQIAHGGWCEHASLQTWKTKHHA